MNISTTHKPSLQRAAAVSSTTGSASANTAQPEQPRRCGWSRRTQPRSVLCTPSAISLVSLALLAGCAVGPNYSRPRVPAQTAWKEQKPADTNAAVLPPTWWQAFNDNELNALETKALDANQDLKRAVARVTEARALARVSKADLYPNVTAGGSYSYNRLSANRANT